MTNPVPDVRTPAGILRLANAFCDAKALLTAVELDVFGALEDGAATGDDLGHRLGVHGRGLRDFLALLANLGLLTEYGGRYVNTAGSATYLVPGKPTYLGGFLKRSNRDRYPAWGRLEAALRNGQRQSGAASAEPAEVADALAQQLGPQLIESLEWQAHRSVLHLGGGRGGMIAQIVKAFPHLSGSVFDVPAAAPAFAEYIGAMGMAAAVRFHGGDLFTDELPTADVVVLGHVLDKLDEPRRARLVRRAFDAVHRGGVLAVYDRMLADQPNLVENLELSLDRLLLTDSGSEYPPEEIHRHAAAAGFTASAELPLGDLDTMVLCYKG
ncbi:hypothetical protein GCM10022222_54940 [Amycolatopsis ultiminotia]|uniref:O-methyltransferase n=1 Tax=Amycolatopsis ultiminotia TaxID=543629 RepID=A0ABP6XAQ3_9PSEU